MYFLDTNTCIYFLNGKYQYIKKKILLTPPNEIVIPSIVKAELLFGAYKSKNRSENIEKIEQFLEPFEIIFFDDMMTYVYADVRYMTETSGCNVGPNDLFIASIVKFHEGILVTNNVKEFKRIKGLMIENWAR
ncbi:MAG: type II toxin-antitoxin system VapC family toxin [Desulfobacteraceae bacterium]|jgi:tRNA(fMet)-specific endonuclease VapC|nr:type II toxin-antitoxin system VapC family toxin [Desulfobacteraceae bacterium]